MNDLQSVDGRTGFAGGGAAVMSLFVSTTKEILKEIPKIAEMRRGVSNFASALIFLRENAENHRVPRDHWAWAQ